MWGTGIGNRGLGKEQLPNGIRDGAEFEAGCCSGHQRQQPVGLPEKSSIAAGGIKQVNRAVAKVLFDDLAHGANDVLHEGPRSEIHTPAVTGGAVQFAQVVLQ
jgi:hypothetical protein